MLRRTAQQRRDLAARLETAQEEERRRIAADIHDDPIQVMSAVDMRLQLLAQDPSSITAEELSAIERDMRAAIERLRNLLFELRPVGVERDGLAAALRLYVEHAGRATGWTGEVRDDLEVEPTLDARILLYRIAQEAVSNARKHAGAGHVAIEIATAGDGVTMRVSDDGGGFEVSRLADPEPGHIGLSTIVERAELAGGWARVHSRPGGGTTVECWIPTDPERGRAIG